MLSSSASAFDALPPRSPTPPRELSQAIDDAISYLDDSNEVDRVLNPSTAHRRTIGDASTHSLTSPGPLASACSGSKKVGFSLHPTDRKTSPPNPQLSPSARSTTRSPSSRSARPMRGILKLSGLSLPPTPDNLESKLGHFSPNIPGSFADMLRSVMQQLASQDRQSRLDAYLAINGVLKAYEDLPDIEVMAQQMSLFTQFLTRDMAWKTSDGNPDINIVTQALKLTTAILAIPRLANTLDDDFKAFLIDRSIAVFEHPNMAKAIVKSHMNITAQPRLHSKALSTARADKLLTALNTVDRRCSGNQVIAARLIIYLRLFEHSPGVMLPKAADWLQHVFHGMLSSIKDVRSRAIETCTQAGLRFGQHSHAAKALHEMLSTEVEDGETYYDFLSARLLSMISDKELGPFVPQIWSAVILFFRSKRTPPTKWPGFKTWLLIIQKCLNCSDMATRFQATLAWNKFVFVIMPDASTEDKMLSMLSVPISTALEKRSTDKHFQQSRQYTLDSYCNLLHYALRPGLTKEEYDRAWDFYVAPILSRMVSSSGKGRYTACRILHGLVNGNTGVWNPDAAFEQAPIKPEELPRLDPRWIRSRCGKVLPILEPIVAASMWLSKEANVALDATWSCFLLSIAEAGNQEVKTSNELKEAIALLVSSLRKLWLGCQQTPPGASDRHWLKRYVSLLETAINSLGLAPFAEDILAAKEDNSIEVAPTPSHKQSKMHGSPQAPLLILLRLFRCSPGAWAADEEADIAIRTLVKWLIANRPSTTAKVAALDSYFQQLSRPTECEADGHSRAQLWSSFSRTAIVALNTALPPSDIPKHQGLGLTLRHALNLLSAGLEFMANDLPLQVGGDLYESVLHAAKATAGDGGIALAAMEPLAQILVNAGDTVPLATRIRLTTNLLDRGVWPKSRQSLEQSRKSLWDVELTPLKSASFDPFEHVYPLINVLATSCYQSFNTDDELSFGLLATFISSILRFLDRSPLSLLAPALRKVQQGLSIWIHDEGRKTGDTEQISKLILESWTHVINLLSGLPSKDSGLLKAVNTLLTAGFSSPHKFVVNESILFWNDSFGNDEDLEYPKNLENILRARAANAEIRLPNLPESEQEGNFASLPAFFDNQSQPSPGFDAPKRTGDVQKDSGRPTLSHPTFQNALLTASKSPARLSNRLSSPAGRASRKSASATPKPRLRHDDSQIQFAPIESSPLPQEDASLHLTEHQKDVKNRQHENAQLFLDFSSSPDARSTALPRSVTKRLNFKPIADQKNDHEVHGTPSAAPDGAGLLMSDDLPSSPTPSSARGAVNQGPERDEAELADDSMDEPPSSPPQIRQERTTAQSVVDAETREVGPDDTTVDVTDLDAGAQTELSKDLEPQPALGPGASDDQTGAEEPDELASDFPSDSILPTAQLHLEEEAASVQASQDLTAQDVEKPEAEAAGDEAEDSEDRNTELAKSDGGLDEGITRVENSFIELRDTGEEDQSLASGASQQSQVGNKKRKRSTFKFTSSKKRKQQSPLKRITAYLWGQSQEDKEAIDEGEEVDDDNDMGEEIVVASSQRSSSPVKQVADETAGSQPQSTDSMSGGFEQSTATVEIQVCEEPPMPPKRGRGRPRKSDKARIVSQGPVPTKGLKRKASTLSQASDSADGTSSSMVRATPAASETRAEGGDRDAAPSDALQSSQNKRIRRSSRHGADAVVADGNMDHKATEFDGDHAAGTAGVAAAEDGASAPQARSIATPRSLLKRLQDVLADFGGLILGSQEERDYDDVLFEFRREVHEAGRRGREQQA